MNVNFLGCGNMGGAILDGVVTAGVVAPEKILVVNREVEKNVKISKKYGVGTTLDATALADGDVIVLGIKPQGLSELDFSPKKNAIVVSLLVGTPVAKLRAKFPDARIVRTMPNLGQFAGAGMTGVFFDPAVDFSDAERALVIQIFEAAGKVLELETEDQIDWIGAISGSGPAYFFQFADHLAASAVRLGFSAADAEILARQTLLGAGAVAEKFSATSLADWKKRVMSPGGTTEQAIRVFGEKNLGEIIDEAVGAAMQRTRELSEN